MTAAEGAGSVGVMATVRAHEVARRAARIGLSIEALCQRAGVLRAVFEQWRAVSAVTSGGVIASLLRELEAAEAVHAAAQGERPARMLNLG